ncbi:stage II sporulation protein P [Desulfitispora alkaliphila]|uniref:stage II sporulation protein P n=1 Tax=Desulfitispora alkaliphila TaxID=622674 RepID=UPI003D1D6D0D
MYTSTVIGRRNKIVTIVKLAFLLSVLAGSAFLAFALPSYLFGEKLETQNLLTNINVENIVDSAFENVIPGMYYYNASLGDADLKVQKAMSSLMAGDYPKAVLDSQISYIAFGSEKSPEGVGSEEDVLILKDEFEESDQVSEEPKEPVEEAVKERSTKDPLVAIYNSHNGETYTPTHGTPRVDGKQGGVVDVARELEDALEQKYGIKSIRSEEMHDYPSYAMSYANSQKTLERMLEEHPSIEIVLDIHRDYQPSRAQSVAKINGENIARILLVVGNDSRQPHPNWRQNLAFATRLESKLEDKYPGISRGVRQQSGRYNQHLHPRALLVEMGTAENSIEEAKKSAQLLAEALAELLDEIQNPQMN